MKYKATSRDSSHKNKNYFSPRFIHPQTILVVYGFLLPDDSELY